MVARAGERREEIGELVFKRHRGSVGDKEEVLEMGRGSDGFTTL